jgi:hypothetical protein
MFPRGVDGGNGAGQLAAANANFESQFSNFLALQQQTNCQNMRVQTADAQNKPIENILQKQIR